MAGGLEVYWFPLRIPAERRPEWWSWLSPQERQRVLRYLNPLHGERYLAAHAILRSLLASRLGCAPGAVRFTRGPYGKPFLVDSDLNFNLSHSREMGLIGLHPEDELGADIEAVNPARNVMGLARRFFNETETAWLAALPEAEQPGGFCRLWSCKEAWMKARGEGLRLAPRQAEVTLADGRAQLRTAEAPRQWFVQEWEAAPGYRAAVVMVQHPGSVRLAPLPPL